MRAIVKQALPVHSVVKPHVRWYLKDEAWLDFARLAVSHYLERDRPATNVEILKNTRNRYVFRLLMPAAGHGSASVVIKTSPAHQFKRRVYTYRRTGPAEAAHLLEARHRDIPVPDLYGYGCKRRHGLVDATFVMLEDLIEHVSIGEILARTEASGQKQMELLQRAGRLMQTLFEAGCNNIDVNSNSIQLHPVDPAGDRIIDWQYARFLDHPSTRVLMFQLAYFCDSVRDRVSDALLEQWVSSLMSNMNIPERGHWMAVYKQFRGKRYAWRERLKIT